MLVDDERQDARQRQRREPGDDGNERTRASRRLLRIRILQIQLETVAIVAPPVTGAADVSVGSAAFIGFLIVMPRLYHENWTKIKWQRRFRRADASDGRQKIMISSPA